MATQHDFTRDPLDLLWRSLDAAESAEDDSAGEHLAAGFAIYYRDEGTPDGAVIKQHPDGRRELVRFDGDGEHVLRPIV